MKEFIIILICLFFVGCEKPEDKIYSYDLEAMDNYVGKNEIQGSFFLFAGHISGGESRIKVITCFNNNELKEYIEIPLNKIKLKFVKKDIVPMIDFVFHGNYCGCKDFPNNKSIIDSSFFKYAIITIDKKLWNPIIKLPLSKDK